MRSEHDPEQHALGPRPDGWKPVFRKIMLKQQVPPPVAGFLPAGFNAVHPPYRKMAIKWQPAHRGASN
jgi:hypothetical protein